MLAGPPEHVVEPVQALREVCGIENVIKLMDAGGVPHEKIMRSIELFGTKVMPEFHRPDRLTGGSQTRCGGTSTKSCKL